MGDISVGQNVLKVPTTKLPVKKKWTRNEIKNSAIATTAVVVGTGVLSKGGLLKAVSIAFALASLGSWINYATMKKNNIDVVDYSA